MACPLAPEGVAWVVVRAVFVFGVSTMNGWSSRPGSRQVAAVCGCTPYSLFSQETPPHTIASQCTTSPWPTEPHARALHPQVTTTTRIRDLGHVAAPRVFASGRQRVSPNPRVANVRGFDLCMRRSHASHTTHNLERREVCTPRHGRRVLDGRVRCREVPTR